MNAAERLAKEWLDGYFTETPRVVIQSLAHLLEQYALRECVMYIVFCNDGVETGFFSEKKAKQEVSRLEKEQPNDQFFRRYHYRAVRMK